MIIEAIPRPSVLATALAALLLSACAGTRIDSERSAPRTSEQTRPRTIAIVADADLAPPRHETLASQQAAAAAIEVALRARLGALLTSHDLTVVDVDAHPDLILRCHIVDVRSGNKALRLFVGYGAGKAELRVNFALENPRVVEPPALLSFDALSTSGGMPGGGIIGPALRSLSKDGLEKEVGETTALVDKELGKYFVAQQWPYPTVVPSGIASRTTSAGHTP